ncbi:PAS domain S-box-containing protein [Dehalogenimonas formicexedens]|uniref:histidine kinase n=2 Tax=Dehalogenimonas TaxID=670486 RepID=A0A1P8F5T7_9CHLR|nr:MULTISPECIES: PAS domain S-box protein [Dehalogenimonas]APV43847.1 PAS domain S-box-containing protein [Dehalogenimonas formicexedens]KTB49316.1 PAS domain S-box [Dehalogenimonas alkenigignens]
MIDKPIQILLGEEDATSTIRTLGSVGLKTFHESIKNPQQFHRALSENHWDVIIVDHPFPGMSASDIVAIRNRLSPATPLIFILESSSVEKVPPSIMANGDDYFTKDNLARLPGAVQRAIADSVIRRKHWETDGKFNDQLRLNQVILDAFPHPIMLIKPNTFEIVAANEAASKNGAAPGTHCYRVWEGQQTPCSWCMSQRLWETGQPQHCEVEWNGRWWEAHWILADHSHYMHFIYDITERKRSELQINHLNSMLELGRDANEIIVTETDEKMLLAKICKRIGASNQNLMAWIGRIDENGKAEPVAWSGENLDFNKCIGGKCALKDSTPEHHCAFDLFASSISLPLKIEDTVIGVLNICAKAKDGFQGDDRRLMQELAFDLSLGMEKIRKREELRKQKEYVETLVDNLPIGLAINTISDGKTLFMNDKFESIYGWSRLDLTDVETFFDKVYPNPTYRTEIKQRVLADIATGDAQRMHWEDLGIVTSSGERRFISAANIPLFDQNLMISTVQDTTARKKAEEETWLRAHVLDTVSDSVFLSEPGGTILFLNEKAWETRGYSRDELLGKNIKILRPPEDAGDWDRRRAEVIEHGEQTYESIHQRKDGSVFPIEVHARSLNYDGKTLILSVVRDTTNRKQQEIEKQQLSDKAEMSSRLAAVGEMAAGIAHEINNPLTGVIGFSELLLGEKNLPDNIRENIAIINEGSQRVKDIVSRMLTFARQAKPQKSAVDITELIQNTLELRSYVLRTANIEVIKEYEPDLPWVVVDPGQLQQVFLNLIVNAEYAMKKAHDRGRLVIKTENHSNHIRISFRDDGPGMSQEVMAKLFQPFFTTKETGEGTGLGLSLSFGIIKEHGGQITAESIPGHGATFNIELPLSQLISEPVFEPTTQNIILTMKKTIRVLVVDDEPYVRTLIKSILKSDVFLVDECDRPNKVLEALENNEYDVIMLDIRMPEMSGIELLERISLKWPDRANHVIVITGDASDLITKNFLESREIPYVTKPFTRKTIEEAVEIAISRNTGAKFSEVV